MFAKIFHVWFTAKTLVEFEKLSFKMNLDCFSVNARIGRPVLLPVDWFCAFLFFFNSSFRPVDRFVSRSTDLVQVWFSCEIVTLISLDLLRVLACDFGDF